MKILKIVVLSILSIFIVGYFSFLFILPYAIDLNKYSPQITRILQEATGFKIEIKGLKVKTAWNFSAGALIDVTDLRYPTGKKFAQIKGLQIKLSLFPILCRKIVVDKVDADKIVLNSKFNKNGNLLLKDFLNTRSHQKLSHNFTISNKMPAISIKKYSISLLDGQNIYSSKGSNLEISDFILNKKIKLKTTGNLIVNHRNQISYGIAVDSEIFPENKNQNVDILKIFKDLQKYDIHANINADLAIKNKKDCQDINGTIDLDKISFIFGGKYFPQSSLKLAFNGDKAKINSSLHVDENSRAIISGIFKHGKNKQINLQVLSDELDIKDILVIVKAMSKPFGLKNLQNINANGLLKADFNIKSDFKKIQSNGYLKIKNANITDKSYNVSLNSVNADVDFSQDVVNIKQAKANLNGQPVTIKGLINEKADANISLLANKLQLKGVLLALGQTKILKENNILSGTVNVKASLKGRLDKTSPIINATLDNVSLKNKLTKTRIKLTKALINTNCTSKKNGKAEIVNLKITPNLPAIISIPKVNLAFDEKNLNIEKTHLYMDNIQTDLFGKISNINSNPHLDLINISIPNQISLPIEGYAGSKIIVKGDLNLTGNLNNPQIKGAIIIPLIHIPSMMVNIKDTNLRIDNGINVTCPQLRVANSLANFSAHIDNNFSNGIVAKNVNFSADNFDLNFLIPVFKNITRNSSQNLNITVLNGKSHIAKFKAGNVVSTNVTSDIRLKNNILYLENLLADAYFGKIGGSIYYDFIHNKTKLNLQGRGLSANPAMMGLTGQNDDIKGKLDFDSNISMSGYSKNELLKSLKGNLGFIISNGQMGVLGKFEHLLYAQNIVSNNVFKASLNLIAKALTVKNTGVYKYMKGKLTFSDGWANIQWIKTSGPSMSLYLTGRYYMPDSFANLTILGRISDDVVRILGPIGEFSVDKAISYIPKLGEIKSNLINQLTTNPNYENISMIPDLTPKTEFHTKEFKVIIDGEVHKQSSVKTFKWISSPKIVQTKIEQEVPSQKPTPEIPEFINRLPDMKH